MKTRIFYRSNQITLLQAGMVAIIPQYATYLLQYNQDFGTTITVKLENYPLLIVVFLLSAVYVISEPRIRQKKGVEVVKVASLSIHIFAFSLSLNLVYAAIIQISGSQDDVWRSMIANAASIVPWLLPKAVYAFIYGLPFLSIAFGVIFSNSYSWSRRRMAVLVRSWFFWRSVAFIFALSVYQYMVFILLGTTATK